MIIWRSEDDLPCAAHLRNHLRIACDMTAEPLPPFNILADSYDATFTETAVGRLQRARVWETLQRLFQQSDGTHLVSKGLSVLELNCGTGEDACWLAKQGFRVLATDVSPEMIAVLQKKVKKNDLGHLVEGMLLDLNALSESIPLHAVFKKAPHPFIFSNFGGLNCLSPADLLRCGTSIAHLLSPEGCFIAVVMGRFCWQESLYFLLKGRFSTAFRRLRRGAVSARLNEASVVNTWYYTPDEFSRFFPDMEVMMLHPVGFWLPPSYLDGAFRRWPRLLQALNWLEMKWQHRYWARGSDHYLIGFRHRRSKT